MSSCLPIIGLCGAIGSGKSSAADGLVEGLGYQRLSFAKALKESVAMMFPWIPRCHFFGTQAEKAAPLWLDIEGEITWTGRKLLETIGQYLRDIMPDIWIMAAMEKMERHPGQLWVAHDVRFHNEAAAIRDRGGVVWEVVRNGGEPAEHSPHISDNTYQQLRKDGTLTARDGDVEGLKRVACKLARRSN